MRPVLATLLVLVGCKHPPGAPVVDTDSASPTTPIDLVLATSPVIRPGGLLYLTTIAPNAGSLVVEVQGTIVSDPAHYVPWNETFGVYDLPADLSLGPAEVRIWSSEDPSAVDTRSVDVVAPLFAEVHHEVGLDFVHETDGHPPDCAESLTGLALSDYDGDGDLDVFVGNVSGDSVLYRNDGPAGGLPVFTPATTEAGLDGHDQVSSTSFADYDNDGDQDLFLGRRGVNRLLENRRIPDGVATFVDTTEAAGLPLDLEQRTMGSAWGDHDGDGDLDLYVLNHTWCYPGFDDDPKNGDLLYRNDAGTFTDITHLLPDDAGEVSGRFGYAGLWVDHDRDGDQDLFVFNDHLPGGGPSVAWRNDGPTDDGHAFTNVTEALGVAPILDDLGKPVNAMGVAIGDLNHDGFPEFTYTNIGPNFLMMSSADAGEPVWLDVSAEAGIQRMLHPWDLFSITWAAHLFDHDNDTDLDLFYSAGSVKDFLLQPHAFFDNAGDATFVDRTWEAGLESPRHGKASTLVDLDGDGFLDLVVANWSDRLEVYRNTIPDRGTTHHWLAVALEGDGARVNTDAFGAVVEVTTPDGLTQTCFRNPMPSMGSSGDPTCHFGLGEQTTVSTLVVYWPDGTVQSVVPPGVDRRIHVLLQ